MRDDLLACCDARYRVDVDAGVELDAGALGPASSGMPAPVAPPPVPVPVRLKRVPQAVLQLVPEVLCARQKS